VKSGASYDEYAPAYKLGYERYPEHHGRTWEDAEPHLQRDWESSRGNSRLEWNDARHAARDAFNRTRDTVTRDDAGTMGMSNRDDIVDDINELLRGELSATETYRQGLEKIADKYGHDARFQELADIHRHHQEAVRELRDLVQQYGGNPDDDSGAWGAWSNTVMGAARLLGDKSALSALLNGERKGLDDYQEVLQHERTPDQVRHTFRTLMTRTQEHIQRLEQMIAAS
jgi:uncharacterized protein (TIGR02284 family)